MQMSQGKPATVTAMPIAVSSETGPPKWEHWKQPQGRLADFKARLMVTPPQWLMWVVRALPAPRIGWTFVGRYDEVLDVLSRPDVFRVASSAEIARLNDGQRPGTQFLLGQDDRVAHESQLRSVMKAFTRADIEQVVRNTARCANDCIDRADPTFDAVGGLLIPVALRNCTDYFGVPVGDDPTKFAYATFTVSSYLFGSPPKEWGGEADAAADYLRYFVGRAIRAEDAHRSGGQTVLAKLVDGYTESSQRNLGEEDFKEVRCFLMGMIVASIPNHTLAGGHILEVLLTDRQVNRRALCEAEEAARSGDDALLECILFEALRFMPLNPGPFRVCNEDYVLAEGTPYERLIRKDSVVFAMTFAAMFDPSRVGDPRRFDWKRPKSDLLHFSVGMHACAGMFIGRALMTQTFKALLQKRSALERHASRIRLRGGMPVRLMVSSTKRKPAAVDDAGTPS